MRPFQLTCKPRMRTAAAGFTLLWVLAGGCADQTIRSQSPEDLEALEAAKIKVVGDMAVPAYLEPLTVETVGLVTGLKGTGSDPAPSSWRAELIAEMQKRDVKNPNQVLASPDTALVLVRGYIRPGAQKADQFDIEVRVPNRSETTSLRGGWLMECRMRQHAALGGALRQGRVLALAQGPILVDPSAESGKDRINTTRGRVLGGGVVLKERKLALAIRPEHQSVMLAAQIAKAVNSRFHTFNRGIKQGVADAKRDDYIELQVHPDYENNIPRFLQVVRSVPISESSAQRLKRMQFLEEQLADPVTARQASLRLEAIGHEAVDRLKRGLKSDNVEVRFHAAEALAYMKEKEAGAPLAAIARNERAFRVYALSALANLDDSYDELRDLLDAASAETRYGAFRAMWTMDPHDPYVRGEVLEGQFSYHLIDTTGPPMVHATRSFRPELVVFGHEQRLKTPLVVDAGPRILIHSEGGPKITVSRFSPNLPDEQRTVSTRLDDVIRAVVELGGTYPDVVQALQTASAKGAMEGRFEVDALPEAGRSYQRVASRSEKSEKNEPEEEEADEEASSPGFFGRIFPFGKKDE